MSKDPKDSPATGDDKTVQTPDANAARQPVLDQDAVKRYNETLDLGGADYDAANEGTDPITRAMREESLALRRIRDALNRKPTRDNDGPDDRQV